MYAIVEAAGRQYQLEAGRYVDIDRTRAEPGEALVFEHVLMIVDGERSQIGAPLVTGAKVSGHVLNHRLGRKLIVYKMRPKKGTRKKQGHRQQYTRIFVDRIEVDGKVIAEAKPVTEGPKRKAQGQPVGAEADEPKPQGQPAKVEKPKADGQSSKTRGVQEPTTRRQATRAGAVKPKAQAQPTKGKTPSPKAQGQPAKAYGKKPKAQGKPAQAEKPEAKPEQ